MKTLLLLRHAKSRWDREGVPDHDRALKKRGKRDARRIGWLLLEQDLVPHLMISSTAKRARSTVKRVASACGYGGGIALEHELYEAGPMGYIRILRRVDDRHHRVLVVGHNPGLEVLLEVLTGVSTWLPAGALVRVDIPVRTWSEVQEYIGGEVVELWLPKQLKHLSQPTPSPEAPVVPNAEFKVELPVSGTDL